MKHSIKRKVTSDKWYEMLMKIEGSLKAKKLEMKDIWLALGSVQVPGRLVHYLNREHVTLKH
jgi:hypothetical protein